ncbi:MAG: ABC transporter ATP-binding protein [Deltaproteobacteria bacterium]|nr:ABC transporter ATP-binding protein [Deltaproteobacteria bacterium]
MVSVKNLTFDYPGTRALDDVSFELVPQSITALVGPNGAGKTTLLRCLAALEEPMTGEIVINGIDTIAKPRLCHSQVGYLSDFFGLYDELTVYHCLQHAAAMRGFKGQKVYDYTHKTAARLDLTDKLTKHASELSRGWRQRLAIAQAIIHDPKILLLDEPASGLDPEARHSLATLFLELKDSGMTLLVSSHILAELEEYSTNMLVLREGKITDCSQTNFISNKSENIAACVINLVQPINDLEQQLSSIDGLSDISCKELSARFLYTNDAEAQHKLLRQLIERDLPICGFMIEKRSMQDVYLSIKDKHDKEYSK